MRFINWPFDQVQREAMTGKFFELSKVLQTNSDSTLSPPATLDLGPPALVGASWTTAVDARRRADPAVGQQDRCGAL